VFALAFVALFAGLASFLLVDTPYTLLSADIGWTAGALAALLGLVARLRKSPPEERSGWATLVAGSAAFLCGQIAWDFFGLTSFPASPNLADACWIAAAPLSGLGMHRLARRVRHSNVISWLELTPLMICVCALILAVLWDKVPVGPGAFPADVTALAYPAVYASTALVILQLVVRGAIDLRGNPGMVAMLLGIGVEAVAFILWAPALLEESYVVGASAVDFMWTVGFVLLAVGAVTARPIEPLADAERVSSRRAGIVPAGIFVMLMVAQLLFIANNVHEHHVVERLVLSGGILVNGGALMLRSAILRREQVQLYAELSAGQRELGEVNLRLNEESRRDALTGLSNRLRLREDFDELVETADGGRSFCLLLLDLDNFKGFNDTLGHQAGDRALRRVAAMLDSDTRAGDRVYRYGGEEILIVLRDQDPDDGLRRAERHRSMLEEAAIAHPANARHGVLTVSIGVAAHEPGESPRDVLRHADRALYQAKAQGRNRCVPAPARISARAFDAGARA
jgi:diguanylate cyclase (GGDEF)-like protein